MNINFYQTNDILHKSITPILIKILEEKKQALIFCQDLELLGQIDDGLWSFSKTKFIPHGKENDNIKANQQPIFLSNNQENLNNANYLITFSKVEDEFIQKFEKTFYFFNDNSLKASKELWRYYKEKSATLNFYKKEQDKWVAG